MNISERIYQMTKKKKQKKHSLVQLTIIYGDGSFGKQNFEAIDKAQDYIDSQRELKGIRFFKARMG